MDCDATQRFVTISGCSGGGKSRLLTDLARRGYAVVEEPGRRIAREELERGGSARPWRDMKEYARLAETYPLLEYETVILPLTSVGERADFVLKMLEGNTT